jgi:hypothetical protein
MSCVFKHKESKINTLSELKEQGILDGPYLKDDKETEFNNYHNNLIESVQENYNLGIDKFFNILEQKTSSVFDIVKKFVQPIDNSFKQLDQARKDLGIYDTKESYLSFKEAAEAKSIKLNEVTNVKPGVQELFESNPELANEIYEALGFNQLITPNDKVIFGHPTIGKSYLKQQGENRFITLDDDYADEVNAFIDANRGSETRQEYKGRKPKEYNEFMLNLFDRLKVQAEKEGKQLFVSNTNILKERMSDFDKVINIPKDEFKKRFDARGATYGFEDWKSDIDATIAKVPNNKVINTSGYLSDLFVTPEQKQQALQQYSQYLDSVFPDSKVKDIVYRSGAMNSDEFSESMTDYMDLGLGYYASPNIVYAYSYGTPKAIVVNIQNPKDRDIAEKERIEYGRSGERGIPKLDSNKKYDGIVDLSQPLKDTYELVVFESSQMHILGNKQDIEGFKKFVNKDKIKTTEQSNTNISLLNEDIGIKLDINTPEGAAFINAINNGDIESTNCK